MNKKLRFRKIITTLWIIVIILALVSVGYFIYNNTIGGSNYCQSLMKQKNISSDYTCKVVKEYQQNGKTYIDMTVDRPNKDFKDSASYTMDKETKTIR